MEKSESKQNTQKIYKKIHKGNKEITLDDKGLVRKVVTVNKEPSLTQQQHKDEVDVNKIIAKHRKTGQLSHIQNNPGAYSDLSNLGDYQEALNTVIKADSLFSDLPSDVRKEFGNDPRNLINFMGDSSNEERARELGLLNPLPPVLDQTPEKAPEKPPEAAPKA